VKADLIISLSGLLPVYDNNLTFGGTDIFLKILGF